MKKQTLSSLLSFFIQIEKMKTTLRHSYTNNKNRQESDAEHSWMMALIAISLFEHLDKKADQLKILKMVIVHDLAEVITGDIPAFEISKRQQNKRKLEEKALRQITKSLPERTGDELISLWEEFEDNKTFEANLAQAVDKLEAVIQHNISDITTWEQSDFDIHILYRTELFDFNGFMRQLRNHVEYMSVEKITKSKNLHRVNQEKLIIAKTILKL